MTAPAVAHPATRDDLLRINHLLKVRNVITVCRITDAPLHCAGAL